MNRHIVARALVAGLAGLLLLSGCGRETTASPSVAGASGLRVETWVLPAEAGSMAPDLVAAPGGRLLLSWINRREGRRNALQFASYTEADGWQSQPRTIAVGNSLVANAADAPHLLATADGAIWAQWLQRGEGDGGTYDAMLARSRDGGMQWAQITRVNDDGVAAEHGFASLWADGKDGIGIAWLDGRMTGHGGVAGTMPAGAGHAGGATQLRSNRFSLDLARGEDTIIDPHACDCCQTAAVMSSTGPVLAWRGRTVDEVRDILVARELAGRWSPPQAVHADGWKISGCPVAGPALAADGAQVALAWYSEGGGTPVIRLARSSDGGAAFGAPLTVASGPGLQGRVAAARNGINTWVAWLADADAGQRLRVAIVPDGGGDARHEVEVATPRSRGMASGYPKLAADAGGAWLVWTDSVDGVAHLRGARIRLPSP